MHSTGFSPGARIGTDTMTIRPDWTRGKARRLDSPNPNAAPDPM